MELNKPVLNMKLENSDLVYNDTKYKHLHKFSKKNETRKVKSRTVDKNKKNFVVSNTAFKLCNEQMGHLDDEYNKFSNTEEMNFAMQYY